MLGELLGRPLALFHCPTRRPMQTYPYTETYFPLRNTDVPALVAKTDYAICAGDANIDTYGGPASEDPADVDNFPWPRYWEMTGVSYVRSHVSFGQVHDGLSNTLFVGEKYIGSGQENSSLGDDQTMYLGDDADNLGPADTRPRPHERHRTLWQPTHQRLPIRPLRRLGPSHRLRRGS